MKAQIWYDENYPLNNEFYSYSIDSSLTVYDKLDFSTAGCAQYIVSAPSQVHYGTCYHITQPAQCFQLIELAETK